MVQPNARTAVCLVCSFVLSTGASLLWPVVAEGDSPNLAPITLAQTVPSLYPTDVTPTPIGRERELLRPGGTYYFFQKLPSRLWFNLSSEMSQRYESNVFLTRNNGRSDYVYRTLPNISVGYNVLKKTSIYTNYFLLKDLFAGRSLLSFPTTQSLALGLRHEVTLNSLTSLQFDFQARELWQSSRLHQADLIPGVTLTRTLTARSILFTNALLQMRGRNYFVAPTRELDPFVTLGFLHSRGAWVFSAVGTLVFNERHPLFPYSVPNASNNSIVADLEVSHPVNSRLPGLVAFIRAEPIWNWSSRGVPGISGYDFRLFAGLRYTLVKPAYHTAIHKLQQQLKESDTGIDNKPTKTSGGTIMPDGANTPDGTNMSSGINTSGGVNAPGGNNIPSGTNTPSGTNLAQPRSLIPVGESNPVKDLPLHGAINSAHSDANVVQAQSLISVSESDPASDVPLHGAISIAQHLSTATTPQ